MDGAGELTGRGEPAKAGEAHMVIDSALFGDVYADPQQLRAADNEGLVLKWLLWSRKHRLWWCGRPDPEDPALQGAQVQAARWLRDSSGAGCGYTLDIDTAGRFTRDVVAGVLAGTDRGGQGEGTAAVLAPEYLEFLLAP